MKNRTFIALAFATFATGAAMLLANPAQAGIPHGPQMFVQNINANSHIHWDVTLRGGEQWRVAAIGDGDTDVDIIVFDENGVEVCRDYGASHQAFCSVTPSQTGRYRVRIINWGAVWTRTLIMES